MVTLGVAGKQADVARQVFMRSAQQAGFFQYGNNRLVPPPVRGGAAAIGTEQKSPPPIEEHEEKPPARKNGGGGAGGGGGTEYHPFITGLLTTLPPAGEDWPMDARRKWLLAASTIFEVIYKDTESKGSLRIEVQKDSAR